MSRKKFYFPLEKGKNKVYYLSIFYFRVSHIKKNVTIYSDGACRGNPGPGGYGSILQYKDKSREISQGFYKTTNNRMELMGVIAALEQLKESCNVHVYSDSKYFVEAINKGWAEGWQRNGWRKADKKQALNIDLWERILSLFSKHDISVSWVKGHADNEHNNRCDELAVAAAENPTKEDENYEKNLL